MKIGIVNITNVPAYLAGLPGWVDDVEFYTPDEEVPRDRVAVVYARGYAKTELLLHALACCPQNVWVDEFPIIRDAEQLYASGWRASGAQAFRNGTGEIRIKRPDGTVDAYVRFEGQFVSETPMREDTLVSLIQLSTTWRPMAQ